MENCSSFSPFFSVLAFTPIITEFIREVLTLLGFFSSWSDSQPSMYLYTNISCFYLRSRRLTCFFRCAFNMSIPVDVTLDIRIYHPWSYLWFRIVCAFPAYSHSQTSQTDTSELWHFLHCQFYFCAVKKKRNGIAAFCLILIQSEYQMLALLHQSSRKWKMTLDKWTKHKF